MMDRRAKLERDISSVERLCDKLADQGKDVELHQMEALLSDFQLQLIELTEAEAAK